MGHEISLEFNEEVGIPLLKLHQKNSFEPFIILCLKVKFDLLKVSSVLMNNISKHSIILLLMM